MSHQKQARGVERLLRQQAALAAFGSFAFREVDLLTILTEAARVCAECLGVPFCKICRYRPAENDLLIEAGHGWHDGVVGLVVSPANETSPQGRAYVTGQPVILQNLLEANHVVLPDFYREHGIISTLDVIIKGVDGAPYGVLEIDSPRQHTYDHHDVNFLTGFANVLAEAVATAQRNRTLHETLDTMAALVVEKDRLLADRIVLAEELKHRVRNNLQLVHGMLAGHHNIVTGIDGNTVNAIIRRVSTLAEVYEQLLGTGMNRAVCLGDYLQALCLSLPGLQKATNNEVELTCDAPRLPVDLDTVTALGMVVAELVSNSYEHAFLTAPVAINVALRLPDAAGQAVITVSDDGPGFVERTGSKRHGVGLVRRLVQQVHGSAELRSDHGTVWTIRFPVAVPAAEPAVMAAV